MPANRRDILNLMLASAAAGVLASAPGARAASSSRIKALAFDAFPIFDPRPVFALAEQLFPGRGTELSNAWRTRQFEYQWLRALAGQYRDFLNATEDALVFAAHMLKLELTADKRRSLMQAYFALKAWPEVPSALASLRKAGLKLAFLSNMTAEMLQSGIRTAGLAGMFDQVLSTDAVRTFKPDPRAYQMGVEALGLDKKEILFVPFAGWDVAGAAWFGYPTFWVNRLKLPPEELGVRPDATGYNLDDLVKYLKV